MDIEVLRKICKQLPKVTEDIKWQQDLCFCIGSKMFCMTELNSSMKVSLKVLDNEFNELCTTDNIIPAPYLARYNWILITDENRFTIKEWKYYIEQSYNQVRNKLPKKVKADLGI